MADLKELVQQFGQDGLLLAIVLRPGRERPAVHVPSAQAIEGRGLAGDRSAAADPAGLGVSKRQVTLMQAEHLPLIAAWSGHEAVSATVLRRNLVVSGINLWAARSPFPDQAMRLLVGPTVELVVTGPCSPCSKMEIALGRGGYNALRGHGGMTAQVRRGGLVRVGDRVRIAIDRGQRNEPERAESLPDS